MGPAEFKEGCLLLPADSGSGGLGAATHGRLSPCPSTLRLARQVKSSQALSFDIGLILLIKFVLITRVCV